MSIQATGFQRADLNLEYEIIDETAGQKQSAATTSDERVCCRCIVPNQTVCNTEANSGTFMTAASGLVFVFAYL